MATREGGDGAATGPLAGARACPRLSTPLSSRLGDGALSLEPHGGAEFFERGGSCPTRAAAVVRGPPWVSNKRSKAGGGDSG
jgi:hypothetical protein